MKKKNMEYNFLFLVLLAVFLLVLICIVILNSMCQGKENFINSGIDKCRGKRDGVSGCRDCCRTQVPNNYTECVSHCMLF